MSMPSFIISQSGLISLNLSIELFRSFINSSTSRSVVNRLRPTRIEVWASSASIFMALSTQDGSREVLVQALPELTAQFLIAIIMLSPSTPATEKLMQPWTRFLTCPLILICSQLLRALNSLFYSRVMCCLSNYIVSRATLAAYPRPTDKAGATVPDRRPRYWPPPLIKGCILILGFLRMNSAPTPLGPYILWPEMDMRSMFISRTSRGTLPKAWAQSEWKMMPFFLQMAPMLLMSCLTPISLLTAITEVMIVSSVQASSKACMSTMPCQSTGRQVTLKPSSSSTRSVQSTHLCSVWRVTTWFFLGVLQNLQMPLMAMLLASVAPDVKMISFSVALIRVATSFLARSTPSSAFQPNLWFLE